MNALTSAAFTAKSPRKPIWEREDVEMKKKMSEMKISGVVAVLTRSDGVVMASRVDCDLAHPGHRNAEEGQRYRAGTALADEMLRQMCHADIAEVVRGYDAQKIMESLIRSKGYRVTTEAFETEISSLPSPTA